MRAALVQAYGDIEQIHIDEIDKPAAQTGEVLVKIAASSLNPVDGYVRQGFLVSMIPLKFPFILGVDLAGTVEAVGDGVIGKLPINGNGSNQEYIVVKPEQLAKLADDISFAAGAALPLAGLTGR